MIHAYTVDLSKSIQTLFKVCLSCIFHKRPQKCVLFSSEICQCGPVTRHEDVRFDRRRISGINEMDAFVTGTKF